MARVHTAIAAKDYPVQGIKKGEKYWYWTPYRAGKRMSRTQPTASQTESNETRASYLAIQEGLQADIDSAGSVEDVKGVLESAADELDGIAEELREKASNIEEGFQHETEQSSQFNEQADEVESWASELRDALDDSAEEPGEEPTAPDRAAFDEGPDGDAEFEKAAADYADDKQEHDEAVQAWEDALDDAKSAASDLLSSAPDV